MLILGENKVEKLRVARVPCKWEERKSTAPKYLSKDRSKLSKPFQKSPDLTKKLVFFFLQNIPILSVVW